MGYLWSALRAVLTTIIVLVLTFGAVCCVGIWQQGDRAASVCLSLMLLAYGAWCLHIDQDAPHV